MKKREASKLAASTVMTGSPSALTGGVDIGALYIDMLCERFKDRGIRMGALRDGDTAKRDSIARRQRGLRLSNGSVSAYDVKYNSLNINGRPCMSSDDFANYYKDLRDYKMPRFYSRAEKEYEEAEAAAKAEVVQESGKPPKKAVWLAITSHAKKKVCEIPSHLNKEEFEKFAKDWFLVEGGEEERDVKKKKIPAGVISTVFAVALSLMLVVCSSVMVSRASASVSSLEDRIDSLCYEINDLEGKLEVKNNMLDIKRIATEEYGMISADYASSRYIDMKDDEKLVAVDGDRASESWLTQLLRAIGFED